MKHGRYSTVLETALGDLIQHHTQDPELLNLIPDLAVLRSLVEDYIKRYEVFSRALIAWHESYRSEKESPKPLQILDIADAARLLDQVGRMVKRIEDVAAVNAVSQKDLFRVVEEMGRIVRESCARHNAQKATAEIANGWAAIRL